MPSSAPSPFTGLSLFAGIVLLFLVDISCLLMIALFRDPGADDFTPVNWICTFLASLFTLLILACFVDGTDGGWKASGARRPGRVSPWLFTAGITIASALAGLALWKTLAASFPDHYATSTLALGLVVPQLQYLWEEAAPMILILGITQFSLLTPATEELLFRGIGLGRNFDTAGKKVAACCWMTVVYCVIHTNLLRMYIWLYLLVFLTDAPRFIAGHMTGAALPLVLAAAPLVLLFGLCYGMIRIWTGSLYCSLAAHVLHNVAAIAMFIHYSGG